MIQHSTLKILSALLAGALVSQADVVTDWNTAALNAIRTTPDNPPRATRRMAIEHIAIFDAANGVQRNYRPYHVTHMAPAGASLEAAIAAAGYTTLNALYTNPDIQTTNFLALYNAQLAQIPDGQAKTDGIAWGQSVAQAILDLRADDGWDAVVPYTPSGEVGRWKPTPPANAPALLPGWGYVTPFSMISGAQFRPQPPPAIDSVAYAFELNTVKSYGGTVSLLRTANQTEVARFWNDGAGTATPPGHWNEIAQTVSAAEGLTLLENARLFALLNLTMADAAISCWDAKFTYDLWRPISAIREADTDGNPETDPDVTWSSLIPTPPFPEYTSGHSTFS
ncbi:MAG TPA: chemotaxis protein CheB, partial [Verrucomicrobiae bacterium]|nr:chemotaxis protein CheB [Verrucomicrobiae bacterium]